MAPLLEMELLDGTAYGPKTAGIKGWSGKAVFSPIRNAAETLKRDEFKYPGVYVLKSKPKGKRFSERVYVGESGESEDLRGRLKRRLSKVEENPFNSFVAFVSTRSLLNTTTVKYLEYRLLQIANENKTSEVGNTANLEQPQLSEELQFTMKGFLNKMKLILPVLGFDFTRHAALEHTEPEIMVDGKDLYRIKDPRLKAFMFPLEGGIVVTKGSQAKKSQAPSLQKGHVQARKRLLEEGILIEQGEYYVFTQDSKFTSTSAASAVCLGRSSPGPRVWIHMEKGKTYGELNPR